MNQLNEEVKNYIRNDVEKNFGLSYEEFEMFSFDEQQKLIENYCRNKKNRKYVRVMIGEGENATFIKVKKGSKVMIGEGEHSCFIKAGLSKEEAREELNMRIQNVSDENSNIKNKVLSLFKKR